MKRLKVKKYTVVLTRDEDDPTVLNVSVPALPGCHTWGKGKRQAVTRAREAIELYLESLVADNEPIPEEAATAQVEVTV